MGVKVEIYIKKEKCDMTKITLYTICYATTEHLPTN